MSFKKGLFLGSVLGSAAAYLAYKAMDEQKQREIKDSVVETAEDMKDRAIDYLFYANDAAEDLKDAASDKLAGANVKAKQAGNKVMDKLAGIQDTLNTLKEDSELNPAPKTPYDDEAKDKESDDIVIDPDDAFSDGDKAKNDKPGKDVHRK